MEQTDGEVIKHGRNGNEYRLLELPHYSVDCYCSETNTIYEIFRYYFYGRNCEPFRAVNTTNGYKQWHDWSR